MRASLGKAVNLLVVMTVIVASCAQGHTDSHVFKSQGAAEHHYTCIVVAPDSASLLLGSMEAAFCIYRGTGNSTEAFPLPPYTAGWRTYDILPLSSDEYLVAKQNCGAVYVRYGSDSSGVRCILHESQVVSPATPLPSKGTHFSTYSFITEDSLIILGGTNGLLILDRDALHSLRRDSVATASFAAPLAHLREGHEEFLQKSMFLVGDSLFTATDRGLYLMALSDIREGSQKHLVLDSAMTCLCASADGDSIAVLWHANNDPGIRKVTRFGFGGKRGSTFAVPPSATWIGPVGDSLRVLGPEGDFMSSHAAANIGGYFYFIRDGRLRRRSVVMPVDDSDERIVNSDGRFGISNRSGLWRLDRNKPEFIGDLTGVADVRDIAVIGHKMYLAAANGLYSVSLDSRIFPYNRKPAQVMCSHDMAGDEVRSVFADGDILYVGTRKGVFSIYTPNGKERHYAFPGLSEELESPYVWRIVKSTDGALLFGTLNHGWWKLDDYDAAEAVPTVGSVDVAEEIIPFYNLARPAVTWSSIGENIITILAWFFIIIGTFALILALVQRRHRLMISKLDMSIRSEREAYRNQKDEFIRVRDELAKRRKELEELKITMEKDSVRDMKIFLKNEIEDFRSVLNESECEAGFCREMEKYFVEIERFLDSGDVEEAERAYRYICQYVNDCVESLARLAKSKPKAESGILSEVMAKYAAAVDNMGDARLLMPAKQISWIKNVSPHLIELETSVAEFLAALMAECTYDAESFSSVGLTALWDQFVVPASGDSKRFALSRGSLNDFTNKMVVHRTWVFLSATFFDCVKPVVDGRMIGDVDTRALVRCKNTPQIGTIFTYWASQLSENIMLYGENGFPESLADIIWRVFLSSEMMNGRKRIVPVAEGIKLAFCRIHSLDTDEVGCNPPPARSKGRPPKSAT